MTDLCDIDGELGIKPFSNHPMAYNPVGHRCQPVSTNGYGYPWYEFLSSQLFSQGPMPGLGVAGKYYPDATNDSDNLVHNLPPFYLVECLDQHFYDPTDYWLRNLSGLHLLCRQDLNSYNRSNEPLSPSGIMPLQYSTIWSWFKYDTSDPPVANQTFYDWSQHDPNTSLRFQLVLAKNYEYYYSGGPGPSDAKFYQQRWTIRIGNSLGDRTVWNCGEYNGSPYGNPDRPYGERHQNRNDSVSVSFIKPIFGDLDMLPNDSNFHVPSTLYAIPLYL